MMMNFNLKVVLNPKRKTKRTRKTRKKTKKRMKEKHITRKKMKQQQITSRICFRKMMCWGTHISKMSVTRCKNMEAKKKRALWKKRLNLSKT